jgi:hypothetical protein
MNPGISRVRVRASSLLLQRNVMYADSGFTMAGGASWMSHPDAARS